VLEPALWRGRTLYSTALDQRIIACERCRDANAARNIQWREQRLRGLAGIPVAV